MKKISLFLLLVCAGCCHSMAQPTLTLKVKGMNYPRLQMGFYTHANNWVYIEGRRTDSMDWKFTYSDSLYNQSCFMRLSVPVPDSLFHILECSRLGKNGEGFEYYFGSNDSIVLRHTRRDVIENESFFNYRHTTIDQLEVVYSGKPFYTQDFLKEHIYDFALPADQNVKKMTAFVANNPESYYALAQLVYQMPNFSNKELVAQIFDRFSPSLKGSYFWSVANTYLRHDYFHNIQLFNPKTKTSEYVVRGNKPTLVMMSASWCAPCHKIIPLYKEVYAELGYKMDMLYLTIDEPKFIDSWNKLMEQEQIPWPSLAAMDSGRALQKQYTIPYIPYAFLVMPDRSIVRLDVRKEEDLAKLYQLIK